MAFIVIGALGFVWMGMWVFMYDAPSKSKHVNKAELDYIEQDKYEEGAAPVIEEVKRKKKRRCLSSNASHTSRHGLSLPASL